MLTKKQFADELEEIRRDLEMIFVPEMLLAEDGEEFPQLTPDQKTVVIQKHASLIRRCMSRLGDTEGFDKHWDEIRDSQKAAATELRWLFGEAAEKIDDLDPKTSADGRKLWLFAEDHAKKFPRSIARARETHPRQWAKVQEAGG